MSQGGNANREGFENRQEVESIMLRHGFEPANIGRKTGWDACLQLMLQYDVPRLTVKPSGLFARKVRLGKSIYNTILRENFLIWKSAWQQPLAVACRHQRNSGSAAAKMEYLFANINEQFPCPAIVILEGPKLKIARTRAREWMEKSQGRLAMVFDGVQDFRRWVTDGAPFPEPQTALPI